jgi:branched-chain amino acid transport system permease protein
MLPFFYDLLLAGVCLGALYALVAVGYTLIYGVLRFINFAHGEYYAWGAYSAFVLCHYSGLAFPWTIPAGVLGGAAVAAGIDRVAYRPLRNGSPILLLASSIGASIVLRNTLAIVFGDNFVTVRPAGDACVIQTPLIPILCGQVYVLVGAVASSICLWWLLYYTPLGLDIRAVAVDRKAAAAKGLDVVQIQSRTFLLGGAYAGLAGTLATTITELTPQMGIAVGLKAFTVAILGGIGSVLGSLGAGLALGISESLITGFFGTEYRDTCVALFLLVALFLRSLTPLGVR